jgi:hypothetical protein
MNIENPTARAARDRVGASINSQPINSDPISEANAAQEKTKGDKFTARKLDWIYRVLADPRISPFGLQVALVIARHFNRQIGEAWPTQETIARQIPAKTETGFACRRAVQGAIVSLVKAGLLTVTPGTGKTSSRYKIGPAGAHPHAPQKHSAGAHEDDIEGRTETTFRGAPPCAQNTFIEHIEEHTEHARSPLARVRVAKPTQKPQKNRLREIGEDEEPNARQIEEYL